MSLRNELLVFARIVLSDNSNQMTSHLLALHVLAHICWHFAFPDKELAYFEQYSFLDAHVPNTLAPKFLVIVGLFHSCDVMIDTSIEFVCFCTFALVIHIHLLGFRNCAGLTAPPQSLETALSHMATALLTQTNDNRLIRDQKAAEDLEPKLPSKRFSVTLPVLLEYLQIADERQLPDVWHKWANCSKKTRFSGA